MKKALSLILLLALLLTSFAGCQGAAEPSEAPSAPADKPEDAASASPEASGNAEAVPQELIFALSNSPSLLDPVLPNDIVSINVITNIYEGLFYIGPSGSAENALCESYTVSDDGLVYTFKLADATWTDGEPITAEQFVYGIKRSLGYGTQIYFSNLIYDYVAGGQEAAELLSNQGSVTEEQLENLGVKALDDKTLEITLQAPCAFYPQLLANNVYYPLRREIAPWGNSDWAMEVDIPCCGPFRIEYVDTNEKVILVKNENWRAKDTISLDKITFIVMGDQAAQLAAFKAGEIDFASSVPAEVSISYAGSPELYIPSEMVAGAYVKVNCYNEKLSDVRVRKAISMAIDREELLMMIGSGEERYPLYGYVPRGLPGVNGSFRTEQDEIEKLVYTDLEECKALLAEAGYSESNPLRLTYLYNSSALNTDVAQVLKSMWKEAGIEVELQAMESRVFFDEVRAGNFELCRSGSTCDFVDVSNYLSAHTNQVIKVSGDEKFDQLYNEANAIVDPKARLEKMHEAENYLIGEMCYSIPVFGYSSVTLCKEYVKGINCTPQAYFDLRNARIEY